MKVAVDVKGTLDGPKRQQIIEIIKFLQKKGADVKIWSNGFASIAAKTLKSEHNIELDYEDKFSKSDAKEWGIDFFDLAIEDDTSQTYLATKKFLFVHNIPEVLNDSIIEELLNV